MPNIAAADKKQASTVPEVKLSKIKLKLIPLTAEYKTKRSISAGADSLANPNDMINTNPSGANITIYPSGFKPVPFELTKYWSRDALLANR